MHFEAHAALGWLAGHAGDNSRRLRTWCVVGAVLPDIDAIPYVLGPEAYGRWHHTFGHNIFLGILFAIAAGWHCRSGRAIWLGGASFASHLVTDAFFSGWYLHLLWPLSGWGYLPAWHVGLEHPLNVWFIGVGALLVLAIAVWRGRTPLDIFSPKLDAIMVSLFRRRQVPCAFCPGLGNQFCGRCGASVCLRHGSVTRHFDLLCPTCRIQKA